jgi:hypothetical protein
MLSKGVIQVNESYDSKWELCELLSKPITLNGVLYVIIQTATKYKPQKYYLNLMFSVIHYTNKFIAFFYIHYTNRLTTRAKVAQPV